MAKKTWLDLLPKGIRETTVDEIIAESRVCPVKGCGARGREHCATASGRNHHARNVQIALAQDEAADAQKAKPEWPEHDPESSDTRL